MNKYEQLIEHIINDETDKARELFHNIVVEKSRDIYESLIDEADLEEVGGNKVKGFMDEVQVDEQGMNEEEEEFGAEENEFDGEEEGESDFDNASEFDGEEQEEAEIEDRVVDLEAALDELKAEFDALMAGEEHEEEVFPGIHGDEAGEEAEEFDGEEDEFGESIVREYVEKVAAPSNTEGADNKQSTVAKKNDMGGTSVNIVHGGEAVGGKAAPKGRLIGDVQNTAGGSKKLSPANKAKTGEGQTTDGKVAVSSTSPLAK